jgi:hypothetical protein
MKGVLQSLDAAGNPTHAAPSLQTFTTAANLLQYFSTELTDILNMVCRAWNSFPCPCEVDPNLPATQHAIILVLLTVFHGRDPQQLVHAGQAYFTRLLEWACPFGTQIHTASATAWPPCSRRPHHTRLFPSPTQT